MAAALQRSSKVVIKFVLTRKERNIENPDFDSTTNKILKLTFLLKLINRLVDHLHITL